jgi:branched-chain amino acid transport system substrate-binding protein
MGTDDNGYELAVCHPARQKRQNSQAKNGRFEIVENLGAIDPDEAMVPSAAEFGRGPIA